MFAGEPLRDAPLVFGWDHRSRPADPSRVAAHGLQRDREATRAGHHVDAVLGQRQPDRKAVARDQEPVMSAMPRQLPSFEVVAGR
jgi:hypothetical protein